MSHFFYIYRKIIYPFLFVVNFIKVYYLGKFYWFTWWRVEILILIKRYKNTCYMNKGLFVRMTIWKISSNPNKFIFYVINWLDYMTRCKLEFLVFNLCILKKLFGRKWASLIEKVHVSRKKSKILTKLSYISKKLWSISISMMIWDITWNKIKWWN